MQRLMVLLVATVALVAGLYLSITMNKPTPPVVQSMVNIDLLGTHRPDFRLGSSTGEFVSASDFDGKTLLINFWATWCAPCLEEMPMLMELQAEYGAAGLQVIGIALDDVQNVRDFVARLGIEYPILVGEVDVIDTGRDYGNLTGLLPYSVLMDKNGVIRWQYSGKIQTDTILNLLNKHL